MKHLNIFPPLIGLLLFIQLIGCGPYKQEKFVTVEPSETAFLVALEEDNQGKFESISYLETKRVASKRIVIPQRQWSTGRLWFSYEWIPTARVIKVDRKLVSRKWTGDPVNDSNTKTAPLEVESLDSIGFAVGVTITARVDEKDASTFLYYHSGKTLEEVIDTNIKSFILAQLSKEFGAIPLTDCRKEKNRIITTVSQETTKFFAARGITIEYMGLSEGLTYLNPAIQESIDNSFKAEQDKVTARQEQEAQSVRNATLVAKTKAESEAARVLEANIGAASTKMKMEIQRMWAEAGLIMAKNWKGEMPANVIPSNFPLLQTLFGKPQGNP